MTMSRSEDEILSRSADEKSSVIGVGLGGLGPGGSSTITETKEGKILRIRLLDFAWKYDREQFKPWKMEARGKTFEPALKSQPPAFGVG